MAGLRRSQSGGTPLFRRAAIGDILATMKLNTTFEKQLLEPSLSWYCEPENWGLDETGLWLVTDSDTDYWQRTHYGFRRDNGHFLFAETEGDMKLETTVHYAPAHSFDQAGLMVRYSADEWIKTSVEMETDGSMHLGAVVTRGGYSDWSTQLFPRENIDLSFRILRHRHDYTVQWQMGDEAWQQLRIARLTPPTPRTPLKAGLYAASPDTGGCTVRFDALTIS